MRVAQFAQSVPYFRDLPDAEAVALAGRAPKSKVSLPWLLGLAFELFRLSSNSGPSQTQTSNEFRTIQSGTLIEL